MKFLKIFFFLLLTLYTISAIDVLAKLTPKECNALLNQTAENQILELRTLPTEDLIECGTADPAKTQALSPLNIFQIITNAIAGLAFGLAIVAITVSIIKIATSAGDKSKFGEGTTLLKNALLAILITLSLYAILNATLNTFGFNLPMNSAQKNCGDGTATVISCKRTFCINDAGTWKRGPACIDVLIPGTTGYPTGFKEFCQNNCQ